MTADKQREESDGIYKSAESKTNRDNCICLLIFALAFLLCNILNEIELFSVSKPVMRIGTTLGTIFCLIPVAILARPLCLFSKRREGLAYSSTHKYLILSFIWLATFTSCITLTHHTIIMMAIPIMIMAQYRETKKLVILTVVLSFLCVIFGVYGGYFLGCFDANLLHTALTVENAADLSLRLRLATQQRMYDLFTHYIIPRELIVLALILLASRISKRSNEMLEHQVALQNRVKQEMETKSIIQWQIIDGMANLIENRDTSTGEHVKRTSFYVRNIIKKIRENPIYAEALTEEKADAIVRAAPLHDIGKIIVTDRILQKPGKLTPDEYEEIKQHASEGARVIKSVLGNVEDPEFITAAIEIAGGHHEHWNGKGYPEGLAGEEIPLSARIMAVADVFDALVSKRVYKESIPPEDAFDIIESEAGKQFDPEVVLVFMSLKSEIYDYLLDKSQV